MYVACKTSVSSQRELLKQHEKLLDEQGDQEWGLLEPSQGLEALAETLHGLVRSL